MSLPRGRIIKVGRKWAVEGEGKGWVFDRTFPTKWKAEVALTVFQKGGRVSDYWRKSREYAAKRPVREPWRVMEELKKALAEIKSLNPTCDEIKEYGEPPVYGVVTRTEDQSYFPPRLHNTWGHKQGGRVHIDVGCCGYHLMLDKQWVRGFIEFITDRRTRQEVPDR